MGDLCTTYYVTASSLTFTKLNFFHNKGKFLLELFVTMYYTVLVLRSELNHIYDMTMATIWMTYKLKDKHTGKRQYNIALVSLASVLMNWTTKSLHPFQNFQILQLYIYMINPRRCWWLGNNSYWWWILFASTWLLGTGLYHCQRWCYIKFTFIVLIISSIN